MAKIWLIYYFFPVLFLCNTANGQFVANADSIMLRKFDFEDKQLSEFFDRFNFKEPVKLANNLTSTRLRNLITLINLKDTALSHGSVTSDFVKYVSNDSNKVYLNYFDKNWYAVAHCQFIYTGKNCSIDIVLRLEGNAQAGYKWIICQVKGDIFPKPYPKDGSSAFIDPMNNEVGFSELSAALRKHNTTLFQYTAKDFRPDYLTAFFMLVRSNSLKFVQINMVDFHFLQVNGWAFTVANFNRKDYNSGWLISSIRKMNDEEKNTFIKNHFLNN